MEVEFKIKVCWCLNPFYSSHPYESDERVIVKPESSTRHRMRKIPSGSQPRVFERATLLSNGLRSRAGVSQEQSR